MASPSSADDIRYMHYALRLASRGLGRVWPNPAVGCVLVKEGRIIATGRTADGGRPHAEKNALEQAGGMAHGATAYITLEPCAHEGKAIPCAQALAEAGISRAVIACGDPDPRTNGKGVARLQEAGIEVVTNVCEAEACRLNEGFFSRVLYSRPYIAMKLATSLDGKIAAANGRSQWITGEEARQHGHMLRATHDAILTGIGTVLADNPSLDCRLPGLGHYSPVRVVLDSNLHMPSDAGLAQTAKDIPLWVLTTQMPNTRWRELEAMGVRVAQVESYQNHVHLSAAFNWLAQQGITRVLAEPGARLAQALYASGLCDRLHWFRAPMVIGGQGKDALPGDFVPGNPSDAPRWKRESITPLGKDVLETYSQ